MRTLVVGDVHGAYQALRQALALAGYQPAQDRLVVLGDTMDGWSESPMCIEFYMSLQQAGHSLVYLMGNHDEGFLHWVENGGGKHPMEDSGGFATRHVYTKRCPELVERHYHWLKQQKTFFVDEQNRAYVHAGWNPKWAFDAPEQQVEQEYLWDRDFWLGMFRGRNWAKEFTDVFIGHSPTVFYKPYLPLPLTRRNVHNLDTGAAFKGKVTVMDAETKQFWQSEKCQELYPLERGRN